jgi:signal peptidase I
LDHFESSIQTQPNKSQPENQKLRPALSYVLMQIFVLIFTLMSLRWFVFEPFTVPSGSMFPTLLVNDYILVGKLGTGIKIPYTNNWVTGPYLPKRGQITVFWSVENQAYFVKRLMGLPGDKITMKGHQVLEINGQSVETHPKAEIWQKLKKDFEYEDSKGVTAYTEDYKQVSGQSPKSALIMYSPSASDSEVQTFEVPSGKMFFLGDHRSSSSDSRMWGFADEKDLVGPLKLILFSCRKKNSNTQFCDLSTLRFERLFSNPNKN